VMMRDLRVLTTLFDSQLSSRHPTNLSKKVPAITQD
jgi:hypothetical protein